MTSWQNLQVGVTVRRLSDIPTAPPGTEQFVQDIRHIIVYALHEYFNASNSLPLEHFAQSTTVSVEVQNSTEPKHIIEIRGEYDWTLQHPIDERPNLIGCPFNTALKAVGGKEPGRYYCTLETFGTATDGSGKPKAIPPTPVVILGERIETNSEEG